MIPHSVRSRPALPSSRHGFAGVLTAALVLLLLTPAFGQGLIIDREQPHWGEEPIPQARNFGISLQSHEVEVAVRDQVATTRVTQVFHNPHRRMLEATYIFPLPGEVSIEQFSMTMNGEMVEGEVLKANEARQIYLAIVRRQIDPGLLEYMGNSLFRARIFPVEPEGETTVVFTYTQLLEADDGVVRYQYPLDTTNYTDLKTENVVLTAHIDSPQPLRSVYSPTHNVEVFRDSETEALVGYEATNTHPDRNFLLYYTVDNRDVSLNLVTYNADDGEDGTFMAMISPKQDYAPEEILPKDIVFVFDTSGSMAGEKMQQCRDALRYCLENLNPQDRFNIVPFSTRARTFDSSGLIEANDANIARALEFVDSLQARGGTAIDDALTQSFDMLETREDPYERLNMVVFMTDGLPTIGPRDPDEILANAEANAPEGTRVFTFGVGLRDGMDLNTRLLDRLADWGRGTSTYVAFEEDFEQAVASFYRKVSNPVLANLQLEFGEGIDTYDMFPEALPDLFKGEQLIVFGRYRGSGSRTITLTGHVNGEVRTFEFEASFAEQSRRDDFVPRLWAIRKVGFLLNEIRMHGADEELRNEIVRLGVRYGIVTPYTSYLAVDESELEGWRPPTRGPRPWPEDARRQRPQRAPMGPASEDRMGGRAGDPEMLAPAADAEAYEREAQNRDAQTGDAAVDRARAVDRLRRAMRDFDAGEANPNSAASRIVGSKTFLYLRGWWVDTAFDEEEYTGERRVELELFSDEYFELLAEREELARYAALGHYVVVVHNNVAYVIQPGEEEDEEADEEGDGNAEGDRGATRQKEEEEEE